MHKSLLIFVLFLFTTLGFSQESKVPLCGTPDSQIIDEKVLERMRNAGKNPNVRMADLPMLECIVSVAVEYEIYVNYNKNQELIKEKVYQYFDEVSKVYQDEMNIKLTVNHLEIITTQRNDTLQKSKAKLGYHIAHLFRLGDAVPGFATGIAYISKSSNGTYNLYCISGRFNLETVVTKVMAHEIGHCFDSPHTHNCFWPDGPIDACYTPSEGNCTGTTSLPAIGTIMSYCPNFIMTFHQYCREIIRNRAEEILQPVIVTPSIVNNTKISIENFSAEPIISWAISKNTLTYRVQISDNNQFLKPNIDTTINFPYFKGFGLSYNKKYYVRIKSINKIGESNWSDYTSFDTIESNKVSIPVIKKVLLDSLNIQNVKLELYPVNGATHYEFRLTDLSSYLEYGFSQTFFNTIIDTHISATPYLNFTELRKKELLNETIYWQVRAIKNNFQSEWSNIQIFTRLQELHITFPKEQVSLSSTVPITWSKDDPEFNREYTIQLAEDNKFSKILFTKNRLLNVAGSGYKTYIGFEVFENLLPNTKYFFRIKEKVGVRDWRVSSFSTGNKNSKWKLISPIDKPEVNLKYINPFLGLDSSKFYYTNELGIHITDGINWQLPLNNKTTKGLINLDFNRHVYIDSKGNIYYNNSKGIFKYNGETATKITDGNKLFPDFYIDKKDYIYTVSKGSDGFMDIYKQSDNGWTKLPPFFKVFPISIKFDSNNNLYILIDNSTYSNINGVNVANLKYTLYKLSGEQWIPIINTESFTDFFIDPQNNIWWFGISNINKLSPSQQITTYLEGKDIPQGVYKSIVFDKKGIAWVLAEVNYKIILMQLHNEKWSRIDLENELPLPYQSINDFTGMGVDKQNRVWIFNNFYGTYIYDDSGQVKSQTINAENIVNRKYTSKPFKIAASASSGLPLSYKIISGPAKALKDSIILNGQVGKVTIQISQSGNEIYEPAKNVELSFNVIAKEAQNINFGKIEQKTLSDKTFTLNATSTSGLTISYQIISGPATVNANIVTLTGTGKVIIKAKQDGNGDFLAANEVTQEFCVIPAKPKITTDMNNNWLLKVDTDKNIQWYFEGKKITNGTQSSLLATENGKYYVEIANNDATCASNTSDVLQLLILSNENEQNQTIKIFPNPADDWITIDSEILTTINSIKLYDLKGVLLYSDEKIEMPHKIKVQHLWKGNAIIEIKINEKTFVKKLILN